MSEEDESPDEYPHDNAWRISMGFDPIEVPHEFMSVYGDPIIDPEANTPLPSKLRNDKPIEKKLNRTNTPSPNFSRDQPPTTQKTTKATQILSRKNAVTRVNPLPSSLPTLEILNAEPKPNGANWSLNSHNSETL